MEQADAQFNFVLAQVRLLYQSSDLYTSSHKFILVCVQYFHRSGYCTRALTCTLVLINLF